MSNRRLIVLLGVLFLLAGSFMAATETVNNSRTDKEKKQSRVIHLENSDIKIDLADLRRQLEKIQKIEVDAIREALADIPGQLERVRLELNNLPARLNEVNRDLKQMPGLLEDVEKELATLPARLKSMEKELEKLNNLNLEKRIEEALESLEGLDEQIEKAVEKAAEKKRNDH